MKTGPKDEHFTLCECGGEGILLAHLDFDNDDVSQNEFYIAMFRQYCYKNNLRQRIKYAAWHLWTGEKHKDQMCFSYEKAKEIIGYMEEFMNVPKSDSRQFNNNDYATIFPTKKGWLRIRGILTVIYGSTRASEMVNNRQTKNNGYRDQLWHIMSELHSMYFMGQDYFENSFMILEDV